MNVLMIYPRFPAETFWNSTRAVRRFTRFRAIMPPLGLLTVASYLPDDVQVRLIDRNLAEESDADWEWADGVFLSLMIAQRDDYETCVANARRRGVPIAVGGPFTHAMPEVATADADWVCFGEAEDIVNELVRDMRADRRGKQYQGGHDTDMSAVALPRFDLLPHVNAYGMMPIQFSRGCPFKCEFCDIIEIYGRVPRTKRPAQVLAELASLKQHGFRGSVFLVDDNFIGNKKNAKLLLKELAVWNRDNDYPFRFVTEASLNLADDEELLEAMAQANFVSVFIGIETPQPKLLKTTLKMQNLHGEPLQRLRRVREHGIHVTAGFILGFDGEDRGVFATQRAFIEASGIGTAMVGLLQAIPHTQLSRRLSAEGRLLGHLTLEGNLTAEGINFIPDGAVTRREYLEEYGKLVEELFAPAAFFRRIRPALLTLRYSVPRRALYQAWRGHLTAFLKLVYHLGVEATGTRSHFWRTFLAVLRKNPLALEAFGWDCFHFYYLNQHVKYVRREFSRYLSAPPPEDVLDQVVLRR